MTAFFVCALTLGVLAAAVAGGWLACTVSDYLAGVITRALARSDDSDDVLLALATSPPPADVLTEHEPDPLYDWAGEGL